MSTTQPIRDIHKLENFKNYYRYVKPNTRNYMLIIVGLNSALRISDILHLTYGDVFDFQTKTWKDHMIVTEQKTGKKNRIFMNKEILHTLEQCTNPKNYSLDSWLFQSTKQKDTPLSRFQAYRIIKEAASYVNLDVDVSCHSLRKTFGYHAWKQGTPPVLLMNIYNHSSFQITKRYLCIDQDDKDAVFEKVCL